MTQHTVLSNLPLKRARYTVMSNHGCDFVRQEQILVGHSLMKDPILTCARYAPNPVDIVGASKAIPILSTQPRKLMQTPGTNC